MCLKRRKERKWFEMVQVLAGICFVVSFAFLAIGTLGLFRLPDVYLRMQAVALGDTLGLGLAALGFLLLTPSIIVRIKIGLTLVVFWIVSPTISHLVAKVAFESGVIPIAGTRMQTVKKRGGLTWL